jgi:5'-nucleotidase
VLSIVGTSDVHGHLWPGAAVLGGFLKNLRDLRARDGGAVMLVDAGDMFQGTLESNLGEGSAVVSAYNTLGYDAVAIGNHEFDFGPVGEASSPRAPGDDAQGALKARAAQARFPFLAANVIDEATSLPIAWPNVHASVVVAKAGIRVGVLGVTTEATPRTTIAANFVGLRMRELAAAITDEAKRLRDQGAHVVVLLAHAGGSCASFEDPTDLGSCEKDSEIATVLAALPQGAVDAVVAGHTHRGLAHFFSGVPVVQSFSSLRSFGRIDLVVDLAEHRVVDRRVHAPQALTLPASYEGAEVAPDRTIDAILAPAEEKARARRDQKLGVTLKTAVRARYAEESAEGNLFADLMRAARPGSDVAITNGGGLRADLPAGELTYGQLYTAMPFDNRFATVRLTGADLRRLVLANLRVDSGILSVSGFRVAASCQAENLVVSLVREDGTPLGDADRITLVTSDFLATGGDGTAFPEGSVVVDDGPPIREAMAAQLTARGSRLSGEDPAIFDPTKPRMGLPGPRPIRCGR